jgi:ketosteroid isomerase-like protein
MKKIVSFSLVLLLLAAAGCDRQTGVAGIARGEDSGEDVEAIIRGLTKVYIANANARDVNKVVDFYTPDAVLLPPNHEAVRGHEAIRQFFRAELMDAGFSNFNNETIQVEHSCNLAYQRGTYVFEITGKDGKRKQDRGKYVVVWKRIPNGEWRMQIDSWSGDSAQ